MKTSISFSLGFLLLFFTATCRQVDDGSIKVTGIIEQQGITTYQYGSHTLSGDQGFYALTSDTVQLDNYIGETITVKAVKIEGYPVDGGPEYLRVLEVLDN